MKIIKVITVSVVIIVLVFVLSACGIIRTDPATNLAQFEGYGRIHNPVPYPHPEDDFDKVAKEDPDESQQQVSITIPFSLYYEIQTRADFGFHAFDAGDHSVMLNDDGNITFLMTQERHEEARAELTDRLDFIIDEMMASDEYPHFVFISHEAYSRFSVVTNAEALDIQEREAALNLLAYSRLFCLFSGDNDSNCWIEFTDENTDEVLYTLYSSDLMDNSDYNSEYDGSSDYTL